MGCIGQVIWLKRECLSARQGHNVSALLSNERLHTPLFTVVLRRPLQPTQYHPATPLQSTWGQLLSILQRCRVINLDLPRLAHAEFSLAGVGKVPGGRGRAVARSAVARGAAWWRQLGQCCRKFA